MKHPRRIAAGLLLLVVALAATACGQISSPQGWASPVLDRSTVYYFPAKDRFAAATIGVAGTTLSSDAWQFPNKAREAEKKLKIDAVYSPPALDEGVLYFGAYNGDVFAVNVDGTLRWRREGFEGSIIGGPVLAGDVLVFGTTEGRLYAVKKADGSGADNWPKGGIAFGKAIWASPVVLGDTVYVATMGGEVTAVRLVDGSRRWERPFKASGAVAELQALDDGRLFAPSLNHHVYVLDTKTGETLVDFKASDWVWTKAAFKDGVVYFGDFAGRVYALDITTRTERWQAYETGNRVKSAPAIVNDVLVVADRKPQVHLIGLRDGERLNVVALDGVGTVRADVVAFDSTLQGVQGVGLGSSGKADRALIATTKGKLFVADPTAKTVSEALRPGETP